LRDTVAPLPADLVRDYVRHVGGDPAAYRGVLPPHLWPQWGFPLAARTLTGIPYPIARVLNGGCRMEVNAPLPAGEALQVSARLEDIDDDGRRAVLHQRVVTGTKAHPEALVGHLYAVVPLAKGNGAPSAKPRVPDDAAELGYWRIPADAGLQFAKLTGDFNPVHWIRPYARAFGFPSTILHGFSTAARAIEGMNRAMFAGDVRRIRVFDCKFTRPLVLPARVGLYVAGDGVFVGDAPGGPAYLVGTYTTDGDRQ
jgi:acyl dehydratase